MLALPPVVSPRARHFLRLRSLRSPPLRGGLRSPPVAADAVTRPLGDTERAFWLLDRGTSFNGLHVAHVEGPLDEALLRAALDRVQARHPLLRMRVAGGDGAPRFTPTDARVPIEVVPRADERTWIEAAERALNRRFPTEEGLLSRVTLVAGDGRSDVLFAHHHAMADAQSDFFVLRELLENAGALAAGAPPPSLEVLPLRPALNALLRRATRSLRHLYTMSAFFFRLLWTSLVLRPRQLASERAAPPEERANRLVHRRLTVEETRSLTARCRDEGTSVQGACAAALLLAAADDLGLARPAHLGCFAGVTLRDRLSPPVGDEVGCYVSQVVTVHRVERGGAPWPLARDVKRRLTTTLRIGAHLVTMPMIGLFIPRGDDPGPRFVRRFDGASTGAVGVTNVGRVPLAPRYGALAVRGYDIAVGVSVVGKLLAAVTTFDDALSFNVVFVEPLVGRARAIAIADGALAHLRRALAAPPGAR